MKEVSGGKVVWDYIYIIHLAWNSNIRTQTYRMPTIDLRLARVGFGNLYCGLVCFWLSCFVYFVFYVDVVVFCIKQAI